MQGWLHKDEDEEELRRTYLPRSFSQLGHLFFVPHKLPIQFANLDLDGGHPCICLKRIVTKRKEKGGILGQLLPLAVIVQHKD